MRVFSPTTDLTDAVRVAVYQALSANVLDLGGLPVPIVEERGDASFEAFLQSGPATMVPADVTGAQLVTVTINGWSHYHGWREIEHLKRQVVERLRPENLNVAGARLSWLLVPLAETYEEPAFQGRPTRRLVVQVQARVVPL